jgi:hypothetical protein
MKGNRILIFLFSFNLATNVHSFQSRAKRSIAAKREEDSTTENDAVNNNSSNQSESPRAHFAQEEKKETSSSACERAWLFLPPYASLACYFAVLATCLSHSVHPFAHVGFVCWSRGRRLGLVLHRAMRLEALPVDDGGSRLVVLLL